MEAACIWSGAANKWGDINNKCYTDHACQLLFADTTFPSAVIHNSMFGPWLLFFFICFYSFIFQDTLHNLSKHS